MGILSPEVNSGFFPISLLSFPLFYLYATNKNDVQVLVRLTWLICSFLTKKKKNEKENAIKLFAL